MVDCNEDGFTEADLRAICSVGESTKSTSYGYIGAKGIGFKSVFIPAWKVEVQSGHFSFYFKHPKGDPGLGMVLPIWQDPASTLKKPLTRITLHFHDSGDPKELEYLRATVYQQLNELQHTSLLFLRNIRKISVAFFDENERKKSSKTFQRMGKSSGHIVRIKVGSSTADSGCLQNSPQQEKHYHITRHMAKNLSRSENRDVPSELQTERYSSQAEVVLAFPLTRDSSPILEKQHIFAFLPIRESNFKVRENILLFHADVGPDQRSSSFKPTLILVRVVRMLSQLPLETQVSSRV